MKPAALALLALALSTTAARAEDAGTLLAQARSQVEQMRFDEAQVSLTRALAAGGAERAELIAIYRLAGEVAASLDQGEAAKMHFVRLLALDPAAKLDAGLSPKITGPFAQAKAAARKSGPLAARDSREGERLTIEVTADPARMVAGAVMQVRRDGGIDVSQALQGAPTWTTVLPAGARGWTVTLLDRHGNQLLVLRGDVPPPAPPPPDVDRPGPGGGPAWYATWKPWAGAALGLGLIGGGMGLWARSIESDLEALNENSSEHDFSEALALERRGKRVALTSNLFFAGAGAAAIVSSVFFFKNRRSRAEVAAAPLPGGAAMLVRVPF